MARVGKFSLVIMLGLVLFASSCASSGSSSSTTSSKPPGSVSTNPASTRGSLLIGSPSAKVHIVVYTDLQCHACYRFHTDIEPLLVQSYVNSGKASLELRYVSILGQASSLAAQAVLCSGDQGKAVQFADAIQSAWNDKADQAFTQSALEGTAASLGLTGTSFDSCLVGGKYRQDISDNTIQAGKLNIDNIPTIFVDDVKIVGAQPMDVFGSAIEAELAK